MVAKALERPTLVLNRNWQPVNVATVARALVLLWNESARVVDPEDYRTYTWADWSQLRVRDGDPFIQAIRLRLRAPEVIVLANFTPQPRADYRVGLPPGSAARWRVALDTDAGEFGGTGAYAGNQPEVDDIPAHGRERSLSVHLPPLATIFLVPA